MLIIGKNVNYAAKAGVANAALNPTELDAGSIGIYGIQKGEFVEKLLVQGAAGAGQVQASTFKGDKVRVIEGTGAGNKIKVSESFRIGGIISITPSAYEAPVAQRIYVGYDGTTAGTKLRLPSDLTGPNLEATLRVRETNSAIEEGPIEYYTVPVVEGDTQSTIVDKLIAEIAKGSKNGGGIQFNTVKTTTGTDHGVRLESADPAKKYNVYLQGVIESGDYRVNYGTSGSGTPAQLRLMEEHSAPYRGMLYSLSGIDRKIPSAVTGTQYDLYRIEAVNSLVPGGAGGAGLAGNATVQSSVEVTVAFENQVDTLGKNQREFEEIMRDLSPDKFPTANMTEDDGIA